ncbi:Beta-ketoacyl synthase, N-terminal domain [Actinopolyspora alba]|uniref:Beta-ketoacyl synthase, N-terminal domain n=1 Tax=Actinopolyspora alba TaxID=673379 RepID=A0A1I1TL74_9ACTN|nr:SDR family NAD(P)-dependent oxidoreductase [Actinopolyspora alba]SFD59277.1 Beta-ketoacyl synthase, N-terminal domain [Actinopolyspora alba]
MERRNGTDDQLIAVVGMGLALPTAYSPEELWKALQRGDNVFSEPGERFHLNHFWSADRSERDRTYARVSGYIHDFSPHPGLRRDEDLLGASMRERGTRWLRHSLLQARDGVGSDEHDRCGLYFGGWSGGSQSLMEAVTVARSRGALGESDEESERVVRSLLRHYRNALEVPEQSTPHRIVRDSASGVISNVSESLVVDTACSSSLYAIDLGTKALLAGDCDIAYCGGFSVLDPSMSVMFSKVSGLSPTGQVRSFDHEADGTLFCDAAGVVTLKKLSKATADGDTVLGVLTGFGAAADGRGKSISAPNPAGQERAVHRARTVNGLRPEDVDGVIAHATGTPAGDASELGTLAALAPSRGYPTVANKAVFGHPGWAAGVISAIHAISALRAERLPAQPAFTRPSSDIDTSRTLIPVEEFPLPRTRDRRRTLGASAFGFGGTNAHLLVSDAPEAGRPDNEFPQRSGPPPLSGSTVLVAWSALLPTEPSTKEVSDWLRGDTEAFPHSFGEHYPLPNPVETRLSQRTMGTIDRTQLMALQVTNRFIEDHGELWAESRDTTGIIGAHTGVPTRLADTAFRCYFDDLSQTLEHALEPETLTGVLPRLRESRDAIPPPSEDTQAGVLPNVIASRIAARHDLHGACMTVDSGNDSTLHALHTADRYLRTGELELALVLGINGKSRSATAISGRREEYSEGAFLMAVTDERTASEHGWPVLANLDIIRSGEDVPTPRTGRRFPGADGAVDVLRALHSDDGTTDVVGEEITVAVRPVSGTTVETPDEHSTQRNSAELTRRYVPSLLPSPMTGEGRVPPVPPGSVVLSDHPETIAPFRAELDSLGAVVVDADHSETTAQDVRAGADLRDATSLEPFHRALDEATPHLTVIVDLPAERTRESPDQRFLRLHDLAFLAVRRLAPRWAGETGSVAVLFTNHPPGDTEHPKAALFSGMIRALNREYPDTAMSVVTTEEEPNHDVLRNLARERENDLPRTVVRIVEGVRHTEALLADPLPDEVPRLPVSDDSVVLVTGGTSGVVRSILDGLSRNVAPRLWLLGRTAPREIPARIAEAEDDQLLALRRSLISELHESDERRSPQSVVNEVDDMLRAREIQRDLEQLREAFGEDRVHYLSCDITDSEAVRNASGEILRTEGRVDLVIHAAGVEQPAKLERKTLDSFQRVRDTKVVGHDNLKRALADHPPTLWCNVGSIAGVLGVPNDSDYSCANAYLQKTGPYTNSEREFTIGFPLWENTGMASQPLLRARLDRNQWFTPISTSEGNEQFIRELRAARTRADDPVYLGGNEQEWNQSNGPEISGNRTEPKKKEMSARTLPTTNSTLRTATWRLRFDPNRDRYLHDHLVRNQPTLPGTFMLNLAANAAQTFAPDRTVTGFRDALFGRFVRPFAGKLPFSLQIEGELAAEPDRPADPMRIRVYLRSDLIGPDGHIRTASREHFHTDVLLSRKDEVVRSPRPPENGQHGSSVNDPYPSETSPVRLSGVFDNLRDARADEKSARATWAPNLAGERFLDEMSIPALLICSTLRTAALPPAEDLSQAVYVPRGLEGLDLFTENANDLDLFGQYGNHIRVEVTGDERYYASSPDGNVLLRAYGVELARIGDVPASTDRRAS